MVQPPLECLWGIDEEVGGSCLSLTYVLDKEEDDFVVSPLYCCLIEWNGACAVCEKGGVSLAISCYTYITRPGRTILRVPRC